MRFIYLTYLLLFAFFSNQLLAVQADAETKTIIEELSLQESDEPVKNSPNWRKPEKIVITIPTRSKKNMPHLEDWIREVTGDTELIILQGGYGNNPDYDIIKDAEVFLGRCTEYLVKNAKKLRWVQSYSVGVEGCTLLPEIKNSNFILTNTKRNAGPSMAEHVIAMILMLTRNLAIFHAAQLEHKWDRGLGTDPDMIEISDKTLLVVGLGGIGTEVARRASALGMRVIATRNSSRSGPDFVDYVGLSDELHTLAGQADVIVNALPLTHKTIGIFDKHFFNSVKKGAFFITVGRGRSTVTVDLVNALKNGTLAGAGLDVTDPEPLPPEHELWSMKNVIITPHVSATSDKASYRLWLIIRENLRRYINGERMLNVVDINREY